MKPGTQLPVHRPIPKGSVWFGACTPEYRRGGNPAPVRQSLGQTRGPKSVFKCLKLKTVNPDAELALVPGANNCTVLPKTSRFFPGGLEVVSHRKYVHYLAKIPLRSHSLGAERSNPNTGRHPALQAQNPRLLQLCCVALVSRQRRARILFWAGNSSRDRWRQR